MHDQTFAVKQRPAHASEGFRSAAEAHRPTSLTQANTSPTAWTTQADTLRLFSDFNRGFMSLDGCTEDERGAFDWAPPDDDVFVFITELMRSAGTYLYGRRMYETLAVCSPRFVPYRTAATTAHAPERHTRPTSAKPAWVNAARCQSAGGVNSSVG